MRQSRCALSQPATAPCKVLSETTARPAFLSCGHREGGREGEERNESRKNVNRKKHTVIWSSNGSIPIQPLLAPVLPGPCKPRDPRLVQPGSVTSTRAARTVRGAPSAGRGSGWRVAALSPEPRTRPAGLLPRGGAPLGRGAPARPGPALPELARLAVHAGQQQPGGLADVVAVHGEAAAVAGVCHGHPDPFHQRRQHEEGPAREDGRALGRLVRGLPAQPHPLLAGPHPRFPRGPCL